MDAAIRGARRVFEIDDAGVVRRGGIERKFDAADESFVRPRGTKRVAIGDHRSRHNRDVRYFRKRRQRVGQKT